MKTFATQRGHDAQTKGLRVYVAWLLLVIGLGATLLVAASWRSSVQSADTRQFNESAADIAANLDAQLQRDSDLVAMVTTYFRSNPSSDRKSFKRWFGYLAAGERYPGAERFGFVERVPREKLDRFIERAGRDIPEATARIAPSPPGVRGEYCLSRAFVNGSKTIDLAPDQLQDFCQPNAFADTAEGLRTATDSGEMVSLPGFGELIYMYEPLYRGGRVPKTISQRRERIIGWAVGMFHAQEMLKSAVGGRGLEVQLLQTGEDGADQLLASAGKSVAKDAVSRTTAITQDGSRRVRVSGVPGNSGIAADTQAVAIGLFGLILFGVLFLLVQAYARGRRRALTLVDERTKALRHSEARLSSIAASSPSGVLQTDGDGNFEYANHRFFQMLGVSRRDATGHGWTAVFDPADRRTLMNLIAQIDVTSSDAIEVCVRGTEQRWVSLSFAPLSDEGAITGLVASVEDVTEARETRERLAFEAHHDSLTGLPNRAFILEKLRGQLERLNSGEAEFALAYMDLDRFKPVNDALGHAAGDELLVKVGQRVAGNLRGTDTLARHGGDEFTILITGYQSRDDVEQLLKRIRETVIQPFVVAGGEKVTVDASFGLVYVDQIDLGAEQILQDADMAMYQAKRNRRHIETFRPSLRFDNISQLETERDLRDALLNDEFELWYQPLVDLSNDRIVGAESLIRWRHPTRGVLSPDRFLPLAEATGLIVPIGEQMIDQAAQFLAGIDPNFKMSINVSAQQVSSPGFIEKLIEIVDRNGVKRSSLLIEMIESDEIGDEENAVIEMLRHCGFAVGIDDFGTGYNSLLQLKRCKVDFVKIDRSFVCDIEIGSGTVEVLTKIVELSHALGLQVVAEGVETAEQAGLVLEAGSNYGQGYYWSKPLPADDFLDYLSSYGGRPQPAELPALRAV